MLTHETYRSEYERYTNPSQNLVQLLYDTVTDIGHRGSGKGGYFNRYQLTMSRTDRYGQNPLTSNHENVGLTFITKPKLNLSTRAIRQDPVLATLDTLDPTTYPFAIRCYLDSEFAHRGVARNISQLCPWFDSDSAYINPLSNCLTQIHGFPSFDLAVAASEDGFFSENQTIAKGSDFLNQQYELSLTFRDMQGGTVLALLYYWVYWIALLCRGDVWRYMEDTLNNRLSYTCSIYRFVLDPTKKYIVKWAKATGCFPRSIPFGENFDITDRTHFISALQEFSVPFVANHIEYMNPNTFTDFNRIMDKYGGPMFNTDGKSLRSDRIPLDTRPEYNYKGIPYIDTWGGRNELMWLGNADEVGDTTEAAFNKLKDAVEQEAAKQQSQSTTSDTQDDGIAADIQPPNNDIPTYNQPQATAGNVSSYGGNADGTVYTGDDSPEQSINDSIISNVGTGGNENYLHESGLTAQDTPSDFHL